MGAKTPASLTIVTPDFSSMSAGTVVTLTGSVFGSAGSFCDVTVTGGNVIFGGADCPLSDTAFGEPVAVEV